MRRSLTVFSVTALALILCGTGLWAQVGPYMLVRVEVNQEVKVIPLLELGLDIADGVKGQYLDIVCHPGELDMIRDLGYSAEVLIADMERFYAERSGSRDMGGFRTYSEAIHEIFDIHANHPDITTEPFSIGQSIEGWELYVIKVSDNPTIDEDEPEIFFNALIHAREPIGLTIVMELINRLTDRYGIDPRITYLVDNREIFFLPVFNPDGYIYNEHTNPNGGGMWRKNRRLNPDGSYGVDLNRNWSFNWGYNNLGSSPIPSAGNYRGTAPFSEPETEAFRQFCNSHHFAITLNFHSYSNKMLYSWSIPYEPWGYTLDDPTFQNLSQIMSQWNHYEYGPPWEILYQVNGDACDWQYGEKREKPRILGWVFEVGSSSVGFWPPPRVIPRLVEENMEPCFFLIEQAKNYIPTPVMLSYISGEIDDEAGGNGNGGLDPGENVLFTPTLRNTGWRTSTGISAVLICADPNIGITSNTATFPNIAPDTSAASNFPYAFSVSASCPLEYTVNFGLIWSCNEGYSDTAFFDLIVGDPLFEPLGPDAYGYFAYDIYDETGPDFNWIEVDPVVGGPGTLINFTQSDQTVRIPLPFSFQYYGRSDTVISVCSNGWIAMGSTELAGYYNFPIPDLSGPPAMIAPFWDGLSPHQTGNVAYYYDPVEHYFVVEFDSVGQQIPPSALETFEVIFYDPDHYPTLTGDGQILFQYKQVSDPTSNTVGIEDHTETIGLQVLYNRELDPHMAPLEPNLAILFSTPTSGELLEEWFAAGEEAVPDDYSLGQNYPNPFNSMTTISFGLPQAAYVTLKIYDIAGRLVESPLRGWRDAGYHEVRFDGTGLASGVYLCRIEARDYAAVRKMVLMK
ncbi:MAG: T9SS type A sorting domain-containing protein [candidate division Zixibacteria bacterium]|nr:T9SS type A sorting domain-containing protein [Candidatus Tariuqbacter arcticus]